MRLRYRQGKTINKGFKQQKDRTLFGLFYAYNNAAYCTLFFISLRIFSDTFKKENIIQDLRYPL